MTGKHWIDAAAAAVLAVQITRLHRLSASTESQINREVEKFSQINQLLSI